MLGAEEFKRVRGRDASLFGAFSESDSVTFRLKLTADRERIDSVTLRIHNDAWNSGVTNEREFAMRTECGADGVNYFSCTIEADTLVPGLYYYLYRVAASSGEISFGGEDVTKLHETGTPAESENGATVGERQLLIYKNGFTTSESYRRGAVYHIFVDRFRRSGRCAVKKSAVLSENWDGGIPQYGEYPGAEVSNNVFFGGDLYGIAEKLDYISSLGVGTIYLSPVFDAYSNHKYDTGDYLHVDEMFGGDGALVTLCEKARQFGIDVIIDGVFNHTGSDSVYFNKNGTYPSLGAYQSKLSPYYEWYSFSHYPDEYDSWWGVKILPRVDSGNESYKSFICDEVVGKWLKAGVSGWRLDVADELDDSFLSDFRHAVKKHDPDGVIIGEVWEDASDKVSYGRRRSYLLGDELDSVMNYPLRSALIEYVKYSRTHALKKATAGLYRRYPKAVSDNLLNFLSTHDTERIITVLGGESADGKTNNELSRMRMSADERSSARDKLKLAYGIIAFLPGSPSIFYGDETGLEGYRDPFCRRPFPWNDMDEELISFFRAAGVLRRENDVFRGGVFRIISLDEKTFVYEREKNGERIIIAAQNRGRRVLEFDRDVRELFSGEYGREFILDENAVLCFATDIGDTGLRLY